MYKLASLALLLSAITHIATAFISGIAIGFSGASVVYAAFGTAFFVLGIAVFRHNRTAAWLVFLLLLLGISIGIAGINSYAAHNGFFLAKTAFNAIALAALFVALWRNAQTSVEPVR